MTPADYLVLRRSAVPLEDLCSSLHDLGRPGVHGHPANLLLEGP